MGLDVEINSSDEEENVRIHIEVPKSMYEAIKGISNILNTSKALLQDVNHLMHNSNEDKPDV